MPNYEKDDQYGLQQRQADLAAGDGNEATVTEFRRIARQAGPHKNQFLDMIPSPPRGSAVRRRGPVVPEGPATDMFAALRKPPENKENNKRLPNQVLADIERAALVGQEFGMPVTWLLEQDEKDLPYLQDPDLADVLLRNADVLAGVQAKAGAYREEITARTEALKREREGNQNILRNTKIIDPLVPGLAFFAEAVLPDLQTDEELQAQAEREILRLPNPPTVPVDGIGGWFNAQIKGLMTEGGNVLGNLGNAFNAVVGGVVALSNAATFVQTGGEVNPFETMTQEFIAEKRRKHEEFSDRIDMTEAETMNLSKDMFGEQFFDEMVQSGQLEDFKVMAMTPAGVDMALMRSLVDQYSELIWENVPAAQQSGQVMVDQFTEDQAAMMEALDETNFSHAGKAAEIIAWYGHNVPMRLATYFTEVMKTDGSYADLFESDGFMRIHQAAVASDFSPAKSMGIDGTWQGTMTDIMGGIAFDPANFVFGPRGRVGGVSSADDALRLAKSPVMRHNIRDIMRSFRSPTRNDNATIALAEDLDRFGLYDEFQARSLGVEAVASERPWLYGDDAVHIREVGTERILGMLDEGTVAAARTKAATMTGNGIMDTAATLRLRGGIVSATVDDAARLIYAQQQGIHAAPIKGLVDRTPITPPPMPHEQATIVRGIADAPQDYVFHGSFRLSDEIVEDMLQGRDEFTRGGLDPDMARAAGYAQRSRPTVSKWGAAGEQAGTEGWVLAFRRDALPPSAQRALQRGEAIEELFPSGMVTGAPVRPVFAFRAGQSFDDVVRVADEALATPAAPVAGGVVPKPARARRIEEGPADEFSLNELFDEDILYPGEAEVMPALEAIMERNIRMGGGHMYPQRTFLSHVFSAEFRSALHDARGIGPWMKRWFTSQNTASFMRTRGIGWEHEVRQNIVRMFQGREPAVADLWLRRFREAIKYDRTAAQGMRAQIAAMDRQIATLTDNTTGALNAVPDVVDDVIDLTDDALNPAVAEAERVIDNAIVDTADDAVVAEQGAMNALDELDEAFPDQSPVVDVNNMDDVAVVDDLNEAFMSPDMSQMGLGPDDIAAANARIAQNTARQVAAVKRRAAMRADRAALAKKLNATLYASQQAASKAASVLVREMWDDFNRRYIATNPVWKKFADDTGLVPWEVIKKQTSFSERSGVNLVKGVGDEAGLSAQSVVDDLFPGADTGVELPLAPIDMIAASELDGAAWLRWGQLRLAEGVKNSANMLNRLWMIDKVFKVSTGMVVSFDELLRMFHVHGANAVTRYLEDKIMLTTAKAKAAISSVPGRGLGEAFDTTRAVFKNKRWRSRMETLQEYSSRYKRMETQFYESFGDSWDDIMPGQPEYIPAMDRFVTNLLENDGFVAAMSGPEAFQTFWDSAENAALRTQSVFDWGTGRTRLVTAQEALQGYSYVFNNILLGKVKPGLRENVRQALKNAAARIRAGEGEVSIGPSMLRAMDIPVRGIRNMANVPLAGKMSNKFFDALFMAPTNYRRGFINDLAMRAEEARLTKLYMDQGMQIIPDHQIGRVAGNMGYSSSARFGLSEFVEQELMQNNIVPQSTITRLAQRRAAAETEHIMYSWHMSSRAGRSAANKAAFPFGKPYADMWAFYGRELLTRPALRGYLNAENMGAFGRAAERLVDHLPINPKVPALISRTAATEFDADKQGMDFSPLLFLPKQGENAFLAVFPGFGLLPMWMGDMIIQHMHDPFTEPVEYQRAVDAVSQWVPAFGFQQVGLAGRTLGGGLVSTTFKAGLDAYSIGARNTWHEPLALLGDIQGEIQTNRAVKGILADPQELADLMAAPESALDAMYQGLIGEAFATGSGGHLAQLGARFMVPVRFDFDDTSDQVNDVWIQAGAKFPELQDHRYIANPTPEQAAEQADNIRRAFSRMPQDRRDLMLAQYPQIAINLVSGWEWTEKAQNAFPTVAGVPYRSAGNEVSQARHQTYIRNDYIRPVQPTTLMHRIIGTIFEARENVAKTMYADMANYVNDNVWAAMPEAGKAFLDEVAESVDATDGRDVWQRWGTLEEKLEELHGPMVMPDRLQAWSTDWRGLEDENFSKKFRGLTLDVIPDTVIEAAGVLGIEVEEDMTGEQFIAQLHGVISENIGGSALASFSSGEFDTYRNARSAAFIAARNNLAALAAGEADPEFSAAVRDFISYAARTSDVRAESGLVDVTREEEVRNRYRQLMTANPDLEFSVRFSWGDVWAEGFENTYGPLDWKPPVPPTLDPEDHGNTYAPFVWDIQDGDTLIVSRTETAPIFDMPGDRFDMQAPGTTPKLHAVRLLGLSAPEMSTEEGKVWLEQLTSAILQAKQDNVPIRLVRDPEQAGSNVDYFGRELAWLFIGDEPYYFPETLAYGGTATTGFNR